MSRKHPAWLQKKGPSPEVLARMKSWLDGLALHTVCESARCPNQGECFSRGTATFLILGDRCTRHCRFCAVAHGNPLALDTDEPYRVAEAVTSLGLSHAVITSVTRDDLADGGAGHFADTVTAVRQASPGTTIEVLVPDFQGSAAALATLMASSPDIVNHNLETVPRLYDTVRPEASYRRSLGLLERAKTIDRRTVTKSGLMLGLGESRDEVLAVMADLRRVNTDLLTLGQYLPPTAQHIPLARYVTPAEFDDLAAVGRGMGFRAVASGPFVRSSFHAAELLQDLKGESKIYPPPSSGGGY
ncbi:MAG: lipoyl synthase [Chloroflexota bacterium]